MVFSYLYVILTFNHMKHSLIPLVSLVALLGAGCSSSTSAQRSVTSTPVTQQPATLPPPAPTITAMTGVEITGLFTYSGRIAARCSPAKTVSQVADPNSSANGWQMMGSSLGRDNNGTGPYLRVNYHRGDSKTAGVQPLGFGGGKAFVTVEYSPDPDSRSTTYEAVEGQATVTIPPDFSSISIRGKFADMLDSTKVIDVVTDVKCQ